MNPLIALWGIGLGTALSLMGDATLYAVLPLNYADAGIALASVGLILSVNRFIRLATNGALGWLYDRLPDQRKIFLGSLWIGVASTTIYALGAGLLPLLIARLLWGLAWSGIWVGGNAIVLELAPETQRGRWVGVYQVWFFLGSAIGSFAGGMLTDAVGYRQALWISAGISALGAIAAAFGMPAHTRAAKHIARARGTWRSILAISPAMWAAVSAHAVNRLVVAGIVSATMGLVVQENLREVPLGIASMTGGLLASRTLISLIGAPIAGVGSDFIGSRWGLLAASLLLGAMGIGAFGVPGIAALMIGIFASAAASGGIQSLATTLVGDLSERAKYGTNMGVLHSAGDLASAIGPLAAYALLPITGLPLIFFACAIMMLIVAGWAAMVPQTLRRF